MTALKIILISGIIYLFSMEAQSQVVYVTEWEGEADTTVYISKWKSEADVVIYRVANKDLLDIYSSSWFVTEHESEADFKIFLTEWKADAQLVVYFTEIPEEAGRTK